MTESDIPDRHPLHRLGRGSGIAGGGIALALWGHFYQEVAPSAAGPGTSLLALVMAGLAVAAIVAAAARHPWLLAGAGLLSLLPVGLYLLATPSIYAGIGLANLLCLAGGIAMVAARRAANAG